MQLFIVSCVVFILLCSKAIMSYKKEKLDKLLTDLFSGYSFREKVENEPDGDILVIQMKDIRNYTVIDAASMTRVKSDDINPKYHLESGDILFICKGSNNFALVYDLQVPKAIAASAFFVLRADITKVDATYLAWYINQTPVQRYLHDNMAGSYIPNINKATVEGIQIEVPSLEFQKKIVEVERLRKQESYLMTEIIKKRKEMISHDLLNIK
jgi:restriction endonuclease S subunit